MYACICMYVCICMYMYVCMYVCICMCVCMYVYVCVCIHVYVCMDNILGELSGGKCPTENGRGNCPGGNCLLHVHSKTVYHFEIHLFLQHFTVPNVFCCLAQCVILNFLRRTQ